MSTTIELIMMAQRHHHGGKPVQSRVVKAAAVSKLRKLIDIAAPEASLEGSQVNNLELAKAESTNVRTAKPYGSHSGGTHVKSILSVGGDSGITEADCLKVQNICNTFEGFKSIDIKSMKANHAEKREALNKKFRDKYGDHLSQSQMTSFKNEYARLSFVYWTQQILIKVTSTEPLEGGKVTKEGTYVVVLKTKTVYTLEMLSIQQVESLEKVGNGELTSEAKVFTSLTRVGGVFTVDHNGRLRLFPDKGSLLDVTDQY